MGSSFVDLSPESFVSGFLSESIVSIFYYEHRHNGVLGTVYCQSINRSNYSRNWLDVEYLLEPLPDLRVRVAAALPDIILPPSRAPILEQMRSYLIDNGHEYIELQIDKNEDEGCLDVLTHHCDLVAIEFGFYDPQKWDWCQIWDVSAPSLWYMAQRMEYMGCIDL